MREELVVFPRVRRMLGERALWRMGDDLFARRQELRRSGMVRRELAPSGPLVPGSDCDA